MLESELLVVSDENLAEFAREQARWLTAYRLDERETRVFVASATRFPAGSINCAIPRGTGAIDAPALLDEARRYFAPLDRGFSVYAPSHRGAELARACEAAGWPKLSDAPGMVLAGRVENRGAPAGVALRAVREPQQVADLTAVVAGAYETLGLPVAVTHKIFSMPERFLKPYVYGLVAYEHERPVSAAMLVFSHGIAGVYWVGTLPDARGRGYAETVMRAISNYGFDAGARVVVLQATPFGEPIYRKLGYREVTRYPWYLCAKESV